MATLCLQSPPPLPARMQTMHLLADAERAIGETGQEIFGQFLNVARDASRRADVLLKSVDQFEYTPVPPRRVYQVYAKVRKLGRGAPVPFDPDEIRW